MIRTLDSAHHPPVSGGLAPRAFELRHKPLLPQQGNPPRHQRPWPVISFPTKSLGGRSKNMRQTYRAMLQDLLKETNWQPHELDFPSELVFVVNKPTDRQ